MQRACRGSWGQFPTFCMGRTPARRGEPPNLLVKIGTRGGRFNPSASPGQRHTTHPAGAFGLRVGSGAQVLATRCRHGMAPEDGRRDVAAAGPRTCLGSDGHGHGPPVLPWRRRSTEFSSSRALPGRSSDMRSSTAWVAHPMNTGPIRSRSPLIEIYTSASGFTWTRAHGNPALVAAPEPADRVGVAPERPDAAARPPDAGERARIFDRRAPPSPPAFSVEAGRGDSREPRPRRKPESRSRYARSGSSPVARAARISGR